MDMRNPLNMKARYPLCKAKLLESLTAERWEQMIREPKAVFLRIRKSAEYCEKLWMPLRSFSTAPTPKKSPPRTVTSISLL